MSKTADRHSRKRRAPRKDGRRRVRDREIYLGLIIIGAAVVVAGSLLTAGKHWEPVAVGYLAAIALLTNLAALGAYRGRPLANWQAALARVPLRLAGYGTRHGKPLEASHHSPRAKNTIIASAVVSLLLVLLCGLLLIPELRP